MYLRDFNPNKYGNNIFLADLCINNRNIIIQKGLIHINNTYMDQPYFVLIYNIHKFTNKQFWYLKWISKQEESLQYSFFSFPEGKMFYNLVFTPKQQHWNKLNYKLRMLYGLEYCTRDELERFYKFWDGYTNFIPTKKAAARESSRLYFLLLFHNYVFKISSFSFGTVPLFINIMSRC